MPTQQIPLFRTHVSVHSMPVRCIVLQRDTIRVRVEMLASRMAPRESEITPRHGDCECRRARRHRSKGCITACGGGNASETSAKIIQISACKQQLQSHLAYLPCLPVSPWQASVAAPLQDMRRPFCQRLRQRSLITAIEKRRYTVACTPLAAFPRESAIPRRQGNRLVTGWCLWPLLPSDFSSTPAYRVAGLEGSNNTLLEY